MSVEIKRTVRRKAPALPYLDIATAALGRDYELSLVLCGDKLATQMNSKYRNKTYKPNVLSFPYSKHEGEIFLNIPCAERESRKYGVPLQKRLALLYVHGCVHLAGYDHGPKMEALEDKLLQRFKLN